MEALTHDELKNFCEWFHEAGVNEIPFEIAWEEFKKASKQAAYKSTIK